MRSFYHFTNPIRDIASKHTSLPNQISKELFVKRMFLIFYILKICDTFLFCLFSIKQIQDSYCWQNEIPCFIQTFLSLCFCGNHYFMDVKYRWKIIHNSFCKIGVYKRHFPKFSYNILQFIFCLCEHTFTSAWNSVSFPSLSPSICRFYWRIFLFLSQMFSTPRSSLSNSFLTRTLQ